MKTRPVIAVAVCLLMVTVGCLGGQSGGAGQEPATTTMPDPLHEQSIEQPPHPTTKDAADTELDVTRIERLVGENINEFRREHNRSAFTYDPELGDIARYHSWEMWNYSYFAHDSVVDNDGHQNWLREFNYQNPGFTAENIMLSHLDEDVLDRSDPEEVIADTVVYLWKTSDSHRRAMLHEYAIQGVGIYIGEDGKYYASLLLVDDEPPTDGALDSDVNTTTTTTPSRSSGTVLPRRAC
jgi:uncharacterized protein YkwD